MAATTFRAGWLASAMMAAAVGAGIGQSLPGQEVKEKTFRGRLPAHYGDIVSEVQRVQIYAVQTERH